MQEKITRRLSEIMKEFKDEVAAIRAAEKDAAEHKIRAARLQGEHKALSELVEGERADQTVI